MIMAYSRLAIACPRFGYKIEPQGLLQPRRQPMQVKLPLQSSSTRHYMQTARSLCKDVKSCPKQEEKPKECSKDAEQKAKETAAESNDKSKECAAAGNNKSKENSSDKPSVCPADENKSKECAAASGNKTEECAEKAESETAECKDRIEECPEDKDSAEDECDEPKECIPSMKMPCCENPECVCVDPCEDDDEADEIAAHVGGLCSKDPCGKLKDPCEAFVKQHIGSVMKQQQPASQK